MAMTRSKRKAAGEWELPSTKKGLTAYYFNAAENLKRRGATRKYYEFSGELVGNQKHRHPVMKRRTKLDALMIGPLGTADASVALKAALSASVVDEDIDNSSFTVPVGEVNIPAPVVDEELLEHYRVDGTLVTFNGYLLCRADGDQVALLMRLPGGIIQRYVLSNETGKWERTYEPFYEMLHCGHTIQAMEWH